MNNIPMKFDYSKTLNEQLPTFEYYKNRYCSYGLQISQLQQENQHLKEEIDYWVNVIGELEEWLKEMLDSENDIFSVIRIKDILDKMKELKGN